MYNVKRFVSKTLTYRSQKRESEWSKDKSKDTASYNYIVILAKHTYESIILLSKHKQTLYTHSATADPLLDVSEMASGPEDVEILNSLGLTINAAKVFLALSELGTATAKTISKTSGVAREVVYQLMPSLVKKGLVEEVLTSPKSFKAIPLKAAYNQLLQNKKEENRKISQKIGETLKKKKKASTLHVEDKNQISIIIETGGQQQHFKIHNEFKKVQKSLDMTFPLGKFLQWSQHYAELDIKELEKKSIRVRIITEKRFLKLLAESPEIFSPVISKLKHVSFRYIQNSPSVEMMIFDKKKLFLSTRKDTNINKMRWLYSNNPALLEIANSYYETLWESAAEIGEDGLNPIVPMWNPKT